MSHEKNNIACIGQSDGTCDIVMFSNQSPERRNCDSHSTRFLHLSFFFLQFSSFSSLSHFFVGDLVYLLFFALFLVLLVSFAEHSKNC